VAFNPGVFYPVLSLTPEEDYTAGEIDDPARVRCGGRFRDGGQFHMLSCLGKNWADGPRRFSDAQVIEWTRRIAEKGGVVAWGVPVRASGEIPEEFLRQLKAVGSC